MRRPAESNLNKISVQGGEPTFESPLSADSPFYRTESRCLACIAARRKLSAAEVEDVVQETMLAAVKHRDAFQGVDVERHLRGWLRRVVYRKALNAYRDRQRLRQEALDAASLEDAADSENECLEAADKSAWLHAQLEKVRKGNEKSHRLLYAHYFEGRSYEELAGEFATTA